jgi:quinol monooxygenase YgiN
LDFIKSYSKPIMKTVRVQYTTRPAYAATNKANIANIVNELRELNHPGIKYGAYVLADGNTFMHFDQFESEEAHEVLTALASFKKFAAELEASALEAEPKLELLSLVSSTEHLF